MTPNFNLPPGTIEDDIDPFDWAEEFERELAKHEWKQEVQNDDKAGQH